MPAGLCKLCLEDRELQKSHFLPAGTYKLLDSPNAPNRNPVRLTSKGIVQTSNQMWAHLLCRACEQLLHREGENWVLSMLAKSKTTFPLNEVLTTQPPDAIASEQSRAYAAAKNSGIRVNALMHFAVGVFWKASVHHWGRQNQKPSIDINTRDREDMRAFLLGRSTFPQFVALVVNVVSPPIPMFTTLPRGGGGDSFNFYALGVAFCLFVGDLINKETCFASNPLHPILVTDHSGHIQRAPYKLYSDIRAAQKSRGSLRR